MWLLIKEKINTVIKADTVYFQMAGQICWWGMCDGSKSVSVVSVKGMKDGRFSVCFWSSSHIHANSWAGIAINSRLCASSEE